MATPAATQRGRTVLFEQAHLELYQRNAFRVLGIPITAGMREIRRIGKRHKRRERLGRDADDDPTGFLPLELDPDENDVQTALQRIQDPLRRLLDEFFWFWPLKPGDEHDSILETLDAGKVQSAHKLWQEEESKTPGDGAATHNLAVLYHLWALDLERKAETEKLTAKEQSTRLGCWRNTLPRWKSLLAINAFWQRIESRIDEIDDPQLARNLAEQIRLSLSEFLLLINARLAAKAAEAGQTGVAKRHVQIIRDSTFDDAAMGDSLREALKPIRQRVKLVTEPVNDQSAKEPARALALGESLLDQSRPLLNIIDLVLLEDDSLRQGAHDEVAAAGLQAAIAYGNHTSDWAPAVKLLEQVEQLPPGTQSVLERVQQNLTIMRENQVVGRCHFCGNGRSTDKSAHKVKMFSNVLRHPVSATSFRVTWNTLELAVPRCPKCFSHHEQLSRGRKQKVAAGERMEKLKAQNYATFIGAGLLIGLPGLAAFQIDAVMGTLGIALTGAGGFFLGRFLAQRFFGEKIQRLQMEIDALESRISEMRSETKELADFAEFGKIVELRKERWIIGDAPTEMQQQIAPLAQT